MSVVALKAVFSEQSELTMCVRTKMIKLFIIWLADNPSIIVSSDRHLEFAGINNLRIRME